MITRVALRNGMARIYKCGGSEEARLEAEVLLAHTLGVSRAHLFARMEEPLPPGAFDHFDDLIERRVNYEPLAYLVGRREFYGRDFAVTPAVLVPRPETEMLVTGALAAIDRFAAVRGALPRVADIGTGSGAVAVSLAVERPTLTVEAVDLSADALAVARRNAERHGAADRVRFRHGDLLEPLDAPADLIVANLPYVRDDQISRGSHVAAELSWEPRLALSGGPDGLEVFRRFFAQLGGKLAPGGVALLEIAWDQGPAVTALAAAALPSEHTALVRDLAGLNRVLVVGPAGVAEALAGCIAFNAEEAPSEPAVC
ncbi:MAG: peptide chain release factor N(5)-glutamine methyltransferase [Chloroflexi bacterium]|nr:peptide chain release factor N(5)-glutamine methyltransferase [Chloroflexota bacterium]